MRQIASRFAVATVMVTAGLQAQNLLAGHNGNFELGTSAQPTNWTIGSPHFSYRQGSPAEGANYGLVAGNGVVSHNGNGASGLDPGKTYRVSFNACYWDWETGDAPSVKFDTGLGYEEDVLTMDYQVPTWVPPNPVSWWTRWSREFTGIRKVSIVVRANGASLGTDNFMVEEVPDIAPGRLRGPNLLRHANVGFESSFGGASYPGTGWTATLAGASISPDIYTNTAGPVHEGYHAARLSRSREIITYTGFLTGRPLNPSRTYEVTAWAMVTNPVPGDACVVGFIAHKPGTSSVTNAIGIFSTTAGGSWQAFRGTVTNASDLDFFAERTGSGATELRVDSFELREVDTVSFPFATITTQRLGWNPAPGGGPGFLTIDRSVIRDIDGNQHGSEVPPSVVNGGWRQLYFATQDGFWVSVPPSVDYINGSSLYVPTSANGVSTLSGRNQYRSAFGWQWPTNAQLDAYSPWWKRSYQGVFAAIHIPFPGNGWVAGIYHGENQNEQFIPWGSTGSTFSYLNSILPSINGGYSGPGPSGSYVLYEPGYFATVGLAASLTAPETSWGQNFLAPASSTYDFGPILWPSNGYTARVVPPNPSKPYQKASVGLRHPSTFAAADGYLYTFFLDSGGLYSYESESGREAGMKCARAPISSGGLPGNWKNLYEGDWSVNSMPDSAIPPVSSYTTAWSTKGGQCDRIHWQADWGTYRFFVSPLTTGGYLGLESHFSGVPPNLRVRCALRYSPDLKNWSSRVWVPNTDFGDFWHAELNYAVLMTPGGSSHGPINPADFLILGGHGQAQLTGVLRVQM